MDFHIKALTARPGHPPIWQSPVASGTGRAHIEDLGHSGDTLDPGARVGVDELGELKHLVVVAADRATDDRLVMGQAVAEWHELRHQAGDLGAVSRPVRESSV